MLNLDGIVGGVSPAGVPRQRPSWFSSDEQYEAFQKLMAHDLGAQCITATSIDVEHLDEQRRRELLGAHALRSTLEFVCATFAKLDDAALFSRLQAFESKFIRGLSGDLAVKVSAEVKRGCVLMPPAGVTQLIREAIEWCATPDNPAAEDVPALGVNDMVHLVLSINGEQERQDISDAFHNWPPTAEELEKYYTAMSADDDMVMRELEKRMISDLARAQAHATMVPDLVLGDTYDTWFKGWPKRAPHNLIGDTPEDAFRAATSVDLREFIKLGVRLWEHTKTGSVVFGTSSMDGDIDSGALHLMRTATSLTLGKYRKRLERERKSGYLAHRRYTFTEAPVLQLGDDEYLALRPTWVLDRFCGSQLYWHTFFELGTEEDPQGEQFSQAMNYVFENSVGYLFRRATRRTRSGTGPATTLITEEQMQEAWNRGGKTPSVCDWVLVDGKFCLVVDATNHWLDEKAAQGFASAEDYRSDVEDTFVNKKFIQLKSTIELLAENGWEGCTFDKDTVFVPLVIVPNAGIPSNVFADVDIKLRAHSVLGQLGRLVTSPGILTYRELQVFEGVCEHRAPAKFVQMLSKWRGLCTNSMPVRPQTFLDLIGIDRPMGTYPATARSMLIRKIQSSPVDS